MNAEESEKRPDGGNAITGPGAITSSGSGGLRLEGMRGSEDWAGEGPAGVGNRGVISGDSADDDDGLIAGGDDRGGSNVKTEGAADITEIGNCEEAIEAIRTIVIPKKIDHFAAIMWW